MNLDLGDIKKGAHRDRGESFLQCPQPLRPSQGSRRQQVDVAVLDAPAHQGGPFDEAQALAVHPSAWTRGRRTCPEHREG